MNKIQKISMIVILLFVSLLSNHCKKDDNNSNNPIPITVTDIDGNVYHTVTIGTQTWMVENLKVTHYRNGNLIPIVTDNTSWSNLTTGAYCNYNNDANNVTTYGRLYNWFTVNDSRNLAPTGWHVPTDAEWVALETYLGVIAGGKLKATTLWNSPNYGATNETGFTAFPGGNRNDYGAYNYVGYFGYWWSSTENGTTYAWCRSMGYGYESVDRLNGNKNYGFSVRCLRD